MMLASWYDPVAKLAAQLVAGFYSLTNSYAVALALIGVVVIVLLTPLTLKSTKGMLEMQRLQPELKKLQTLHRGDRQKLNEEMMKLYQEHKVNPLASCLPMLAQMPVFLLMYRVIRGLANRMADGGFKPKYVAESSKIYKALVASGKEGARQVRPAKMLSFGLDLSKTPSAVMKADFGRGVVYALLIIVLGFLYWWQQRQIASRQVNPTMSAQQQKLMQYLPVFFAVFQLFLPTALVIYYISQTILRIGQQAYITRRFYKGDDSLGAQANAAGKHARELAEADKADKANKPSGPTARRSLTGQPVARPGDKRSAPTRANPAAKNPGAKNPANRPAGSPTHRQQPPRPAGPGRPGADRPQSGSRHPKPNTK
jgi:YidC/Oxa1 family membrane protein insertase